jgi:uncharacterized protein YkwD
MDSSNVIISSFSSDDQADQQYENSNPDADDDGPDTESAVPTDSEAQVMLDMVNQERQRKGLSPLLYDARAEKVAQTKAADLIKNDYLDHNSSKLGSIEAMLRQKGVTGIIFSESIAQCESVEIAYMVLLKSVDQQQGFTSDHFTHIGIGVVKGGKWGRVFVQLLMGPEPSASFVMNPEKADTYVQ